jgi:SAM-dependent methyltransferase
MKSRGQRDFATLPPFAARLYASLTRTRAIARQNEQIASDLATRIVRGRLLEVGLGPGSLLREVHRVNPDLDLCGLDISEAMVALARKNLEGIPADLRCGDVRATGYPDGHFDLATCTGSFYLWDEPERGLDELARVLRPGGAAILFETRRDVDEAEVRRAIGANLVGEAALRRMLAPFFLRRQLRMTYATSEVEGIIRKTAFSNTFSIEPVALGGLPAWLRIELTKRG